MGIRFDTLTKAQRLGVAVFTRRQYELIAFLQPETYVSRNAKANVRAQYTPGNGYPDWSPYASSSSATTCFNVVSGKAAYSVDYQGGSNFNCGISFKMQAGD